MREVKEWLERHGIGAVRGAERVHISASHWFGVSVRISQDALQYLIGGRRRGGLPFRNRSIVLDKRIMIRSTVADVPRKR